MGWSPQFASGSGEGAVAYLVNAPILLARSGLSENHQGGKTGGRAVEMPPKFCTLSLGFPKNFGGIAQLVERLVRNEKARGSNPLTSSLRLPS